MVSDRQTELERRVMQMLLAGDHPLLATLRAQYDAASLARREKLGDSIFIHFHLPSGIPRVNPATFLVYDVWLELEGFPDGASATLHVSDGAISMLECSVIEGEWPDDPVVEDLRYAVWQDKWWKKRWRTIPSATRDLEGLDFLRSA